MKMREKGFIQYITIIIIILVIVFLSQQPYFRGYGKNISREVEALVGSYWLKTAEWTKINIYPKIGGEVAKRGEALKEEVAEKITEQKNNFVKNIWNKFKNYFANIFLKTTGTQVQ